MKYLGKITKILGMFLLIVCLASCQMGGSTTDDPTDDPTIDQTEDYCIKFETNGGAEINDLNDLEVGDVIALPTPSRDGYLFAGWYESNDFSTTRLNKTYTYKEQITLYANWLAQGFTVTLVSNEVSIKVKEYSFKCDQEIVIPEPTSEYFNFVGWFDQDGNAFDMSKMPAYDIILVAKWEAKDIQVSFDLNGGVAPSGFEDSVSIKSGETIEMPAPTKDGSLFKGWYDENGNKFTSTTEILTSVTLIARWDNLSNYESSYGIDYVLNEGMLPAGTKHEYYVGVETTLPIPTKEGFEFAGWYDNEIFYGEKVTSISATTICKLTFYAKWNEIKDQYRVTFIDHKKVYNEVYVDAGSKVTKQSLPQYGGADLTC